MLVNLWRKSKAFTILYVGIYGIQPSNVFEGHNSRTDTPWLYHFFISNAVNAGDFQEYGKFVFENY